MYLRIMDIKDSIMTKYDSFLETLKSQRNRFIELRGETKAFDQIKQPFLEATISSIDKSIEEIEFCKSHYIWDRLVIAFFGQTNAGKSTIIDTFRILFNEKKRLSLLKKDKSGDGVDGLIVGDGRNDFTKVYEEYEMTINGMPFTLIDVPGIEGNEEDYKDEIKEALSKAHCVFYIQGENKAPDEAIASKIKKYLNDWVKVYSVFNVRGGVINYDEEEERETLLRKDVPVNERLIQDCFEKQLGSVYGGNVTIQALLAMCSKAKFSTTREKLIKQQAKLTKYFGTAESMFAFSRFDELLKIVLSKALSFQNEIADANKRKLRKLAINARNQLKEVASSQDSAISEMEQQLLDFKKYVDTATSTCKRQIKSQSESAIQSCFTSLKINIYRMIDNDAVSKDRVKHLCDFEANKLKIRIPQIIQENIIKLETNISNKARELSELTKKGKYSTTFIKLGVSPNLDNAFNDLDINIKDIGSLALDVGSWALALSSFGGWIGAAVGAALGLVLHILKKVFFSDHGKSKAKEKVQKELDSCKIKVLEDFHIQLLPLLSRLDSHKNTIQSTIRDEYESLTELSAIVDNDLIELRKYINIQIG